MVVVCCQLFVVFVVCYLLLWLLFVGRCVLLVVCCVVFGAWCYWCLAFRVWAFGVLELCFACCCSMFVVGCMFVNVAFFVSSCLLCVVYVFVDCCLLLFVVVRWLLLIVCCMLLVDCC